MSRWSFIREPALLTSQMSHSTWMRVYFRHTGGYFLACPMWPVITSHGMHPTTNNVSWYPQYSTERSKAVRTYPDPHWVTFIFFKDALTACCLQREANFSGSIFLLQREKKSRWLSALLNQAVGDHLEEIHLIGFSALSSSGVVENSRCCVLIKPILQI